MVKETLLAELDHEMAVTRRVLERVPDAALDWQPHDRSFSLGGLATHLARLPHWGAQILDHDAYDLVTASGTRPPAEKTMAAVLDLFDRHVTEVRSRVVSREDAELTAPWSLTRGDRVILSMPRLAALRRFLLHHVIHHRGQLTVYLRLQNVAVPPIYGPTADEPL